MRVFNDSGLSIGWCSSRVPPHGRTATLIVKGTFRLVPGAPAERAEEQPPLTGDVPEEGGPAIRYASDFAWFKPKADLLLVGSCHAPGGAPTAACRVTFQVGSWKKQLAVVGDRVFRRRWLVFPALSEPEPFARVRLSYRNSYGGPGYAANRVGRGHAERFDARRPLPNLFQLRDVYVDADSRPEPAAFGPMPVTWPQRGAKAGTYNRAWLRERWPDLPENFDWSLMNAAPRDQQLASYLKGQERVLLEHLHPRHAVYESALPGLRARWFLRANDRFLEVPLHLDTLWIDTDAETAVLLWRGVHPVGHVKMKEIQEHYIVTEPVAEAPKSVEHYAELLERRKAERAAAFPAPAFSDPPPPSAPERPDMSWRRKFDEDFARMRAELDRLEEQALATRPVIDKNLARYGVAAPVYDVPAAPPGDLKDLHARLLKAYAEAKVRHPAMAAKLAPPPTLAELEEALAVPAPPKERPPAPEPRPIPPPAIVEQDLSGRDLSRRSFKDAVLRGMKLRGSNFSGSDLTRANLAGADLSGADLRGAVLKDADLTEANLEGADLSQAVLERAELSRARMVGAILTGALASRAGFASADLTRVRAKDASFAGADLTGADLAGADLRSAVLAGVTAAGTQGPGTVFEGADLTRFRATDAARFPGANFRSVRAAQSIWEGASLEEADFSKAVLVRANFTEARLSRALLNAADLRQARLVEARLDGAHLLKANLFRATLEGADLAGADVRGANLYEAELLNAKTEGASFELADLTGTKRA